MKETSHNIGRPQRRNKTDAIHRDPQSLRTPEGTEHLMQP